MKINNLIQKSLLFGIFLSAAVRAQPASLGKNDPSYILRPNDSISVEIYQEPDLSGSFRLLRTGQASFQLIGLVSLSGLSVTEASKKIHDLYAAKYLVDPKVTLSVDSYATEFVTVLGAVRSPGQVAIPISGNLDLATAMASVGGLTGDANQASIIVTRAAGGSTPYTQSQIDGAAGKVRLNSGDRIIVNKSSYIGKTITVLGPVGKPGPMPFPLDGKMDIIDAIAYAGGMTDMANPRKVTVNRKGTILKLDFKAISESGDRTHQILPGDVIKVAERLF